MAHEFLWVIVVNYRIKLLLKQFAADVERHFKHNLWHINAMVFVDTYLYGVYVRNCQFSEQLMANSFPPTPKTLNVFKIINSKVSLRSDKVVNKLCHRVSSYSILC